MAGWYTVATEIPASVLTPDNGAYRQFGPIVNPAATALLVKYPCQLTLSVAFDAR
jgi:hypothetical protein